MNLGGPQTTGMIIPPTRDFPRRKTIIKADLLRRKIFIGGALQIRTDLAEEILKIGMTTQGSITNLIDSDSITHLNRNEADLVHVLIFIYDEQKS